jgi:hypothetical protein
VADRGQGCRDIVRRRRSPTVPMPWFRKSFPDFFKALAKNNTTAW